MRIATGSVTHDAIVNRRAETLYVETEEQYVAIMYDILLAF